MIMVKRLQYKVTDRLPAVTFSVSINPDFPNFIIPDTLV